MVKITVTTEDGLFSTPEEAMVAVINKALRTGLGVPSGDIDLIEAELNADDTVGFRFRKFSLTFSTFKFADNNVITEFGRKFANAYQIPYSGPGGNAWGASTYLMGSRGHYFTIRNEAMAGITVLDLGSTVGEEVIINVTGWGKFGSDKTNASMMIQAKGEALIHASSKVDEGGFDWPASTNVIYRSLFTPSTTIVNSANKDGYVLVPYKPSNSTFKSSGDILVGCGNYLALSSGYVSIGEHGMAVIPDPQLGSKLVSNTYLFMEDKEGNS